MADHVARRTDTLRNLGTTFDLVEESGWRELQQICQQVQSSPVRHAENNVLNTGLTSRLALRV